MRRSQPRRVRHRTRLAVALGVLALVVLGPAAPAEAHAFLAGSNPADGEVLAAAPAELRLDFSESVVLNATRIDVVDGRGAHVQPAALRLEAADSEDDEQPVQVVASLPPLARGTYRVTWQTLSSDDLHRTSGVLAFGVGEDVASAGTVDEAPAAGEGLSRWVLWAGLSGVLGPLVVSALAGSTLVGRRRTRVVRVARWSSAGLLGACLVLPAVQLRSLSDAWAAAREPSIGAGWGGRVLAAAVVALVVWRASGRDGSWAPRRAPLLGALLLVPLLTAWRGHLGTNGSGLLMVADVLHSASAATWAGAVVALVVVQAGRDGPRATIEARRFAVVAAGCVALAVATGLLLAGHGVATTSALLQADYGRLLLLKVGLLLAVLALALVNNRRGRRTTTWGARTDRRVAAEAGLLVLLLAGAGFLAATAPASSPRWVPAPTPSRLVSVRVADLLMEVAVGPNRTGAAFVTVDVLQTRRPAPAPVSAVRVTLRRSGFEDIVGAAAMQPDGTWVLPVEVPDAGRWHVALRADRRGLPPVTAETAWVVAGGVHGPPGRSLAAASRWLAAAVVLLWALWWLVSGGRPPRVPRRTAAADARRRAQLGRTLSRERAVGGATPLALVLLVAGLVGPGTASPRAPTRAQRSTPAAETSTPSSGTPLWSRDEPVGRRPPPASVTSPTSTAVAAGGSDPGRRSDLQAPHAAVAGDLLGGSDAGRVLPSALLAAYRAAAAGAPSRCHLQVSLLAAIGQVESASLAGRRLDAAHRPVPRVLGPVLDGRTTAAVRDTDSGRWDGDARWDRAVGPMQFIPGTWAVAGVDADADGRADPQDVDDATAAAAGYLCAGGRDLALPSGTRAAILSYNHSTAYLRTVLGWQRRFSSGGLVAARPTPVATQDEVTASPRRGSRSTRGAVIVPVTGVTRPPAVVGLSRTGRRPSTRPRPSTTSAPAAPVTAPTSPPVTAPTSTPTTPTTTLPAMSSPTTPTTAPTIPAPPLTGPGSPSTTTSGSVTCPNPLPGPGEPTTAGSAPTSSQPAPPDPTSTTSGASGFPPVVFPADVAVGCVPPQPTGTPVPPVTSVTGGPVPVP